MPSNTEQMPVAIALANGRSAITSTVNEEAQGLAVLGTIW
jgi:hypothetical protein